MSPPPPKKEEKITKIKTKDKKKKLNIYKNTDICQGKKIV